ncbi:demethylmenaquinone methyltransferase-like [Anneissia japonica]|uniref:demethylmenaquinone methyltransferase-like n=1 Tax=Anneissia japonica TaxID=1529436 RepID=UPI001425673D|nr:demethylmenaquinone methyltransferase-like [Anneissia japonica]XP_033104428.1 demethylmenaquinone methyltransferase-like [Anneissia japonica]
MTLRTVIDLIPNKSTRILDFAASTGLFGKLLHDNGYTNIDAFDGSSVCMEQARKRNVYKNFIVEFVSDARLSIDDDSYDALICYGGMAKNHLPISVFSEWIRCVKPGGYIINAFRMKWLKDAPTYSKGKLEAEIERLEKEKKWKFIRREMTNDEDPDKVVIKFAHQVC